MMTWWEICEVLRENWCSWEYEERMLSEDGESCIVNWVLIMRLYLT
jgi:hypothetical protein